ncbi:MAG TPA: hypothetical protein VMG82_37035 [Candidatus Sulfotelmatobacter sp.]|nr:hypothetical protein [Candidatus Sulfotelmatobacter sp.]
MKIRLYSVAIGRGLSIVSFLLCACRSNLVAPTPTVVISQVPTDNSKTPEQARILGHVTGARPSQRLVLYARTEGRWGIQPSPAEPFTRIENDGHWASSTQLGSEYAALLVDAGFSPPELTESLPNVGSGVAASAIVNDRGSAAVFPPPKAINFSGYEWAMSSGSIYRAGSRNSFDPSNVWTDPKGALHLRISSTSGKWIGAEVRLTRSLGYGTYRFQVRDISQLEPSAVLTLVTWDGVGTEQNRRELDVELSRWGYVNNDNAHYVVQPYYVPANIVRFRVPAGIFTHAIHWEPGQVTFTTAAGSGGPESPLLKQHVFTSGVPAAGNETVRISLYVFHQGQTRLKTGDEVVIDKFEYLP